MEDQVIRKRRRVPRKVTLGQKISRLIAAPDLPRSRRQQRLAILAVAVVFGMYLLIGPVLGDIFGGKNSSPSGPPPKGLANKK
jgi:hypothetical protein